MMNAWFSGLSLEEQLYYGIAIVATGLVLLQLVLMMVGVGAEELVSAGDMDMDGPDDHPSGIHLLSSRTVVAFFMGFGWTGAMRVGESASSTMTVLPAVLVGLGFAYSIFRLMNFLHGLRHSGTLDYENAVGEVGTVYLVVHPAMKPGGQIQVMIQGRLKTVQALTRQSEPIANGDRVLVTELLDQGTLVVEPISDTSQIR